MDVAILDITLATVAMVTGKKIQARLPLRIHTDSIRDVTVSCCVNGTF